ncbi:DNA primase family protein [Salibacterium qingdaonense]|uniref:Putative DNA primase/helicase n=1 Tax=Salibacterium qingdaonense TaxID=266892 RepID=A0A1I4NY91_9BACI|nr:phage/plasmid primase, P4 family [Salibacterium qingdaonense]SFM20492.1 putative DNA primase/helicase [Salibacterium qingdaonense]
MDVKRFQANQNRMMDVVEPEQEETTAFQMTRDPFFQWAEAANAKMSEPLLQALISNTVSLGQAGEEYRERVIKPNHSEDYLADLMSRQHDMVPTSYPVLEQLGYDGERKAGTPAGCVLADVREAQFQKRGLAYNKNGHLELNANIFASYILRRIRLVQLSGGHLFVYGSSGVYQEITQDWLKKVCREILHEAESNIWKVRWQNEYYEALKREIPFVVQMNPDTQRINIKNGMLDLYHEKLVPHDPGYLSTVQIPITYNAGASCPQFRKFLFDVFENDQERVDLIQELMGYCFLPEVKIQKAFFFVGSGSNGKSVLAEIIRHLIGTANVSNVSLDELKSRFGMQNLPGKFVNISSENEVTKKFNTQTFKMVTGGDAVNVERKYQDSFNTHLPTKLLILLNHMVDTDDMTEGFYRRLQIIPFHKEYKELKAGEAPVEGVSYMDKDLTNKLLQELPGILNFALQGLSRLRANDFNLTQSQVSDEALRDYKASQNPLVEYFNERVYSKPEASVLRSEFKKDFAQWARENGRIADGKMGTTKFWSLFDKVLQDHHITTHTKKIQGHFYVEGIQLQFHRRDENYVDPC